MRFREQHRGGGAEVMRARAPGAAAITPLLAAASLFVASAAHAQDTYYHKPSEAVVRVLEAPPFPTIWTSPTRDVALVASKDGYPPLSELAAPKLKLAGIRV